MSRWTNFNVEEIQEQISDIQIQLESLNSLDPNITTSMPDFPFEIARAIEVLSFIYDYLKTIKPHLLRSGYSSQDIIYQITNISNSISQFQVDKNFGHITNINGYIDNILSYLSQNTFPTLQKSKTNTSLSKLTQSYEKNIETSLEKINFPNVVEKTNAINEAYKEICGTNNEDDEENILTQIKNAKEKTNQYLQEIQETCDVIYYDNDEKEEKSLITQIENARDTIKKLEQKSQESNDAIQNTIQELQKFYYKVFGGQNQNGEKIEGIEDRLEAREKETEETLQNLEQKFEGFCKKKESELQEHYNRAKEAYDMSITGGLSKTFDRQALWQKIASFIWILVFLISLAGIFSISLWTYQELLANSEIKRISNPQPNILLGIIFRFLLAIPCIWLAIFASQRRAEAQRLAQEYTHKATTLQTYLLHKEEIEKLNKDDADLLSKLISSTIDTVAFNPSSSLDKTNKNKDYKNIIKDTKEIIKDTKEIIQEVSPHKDTKEIIQQEEKQE